ncbi:MAG: hypothetical protein A2W31_05390 [Planctomycetes bacterium RBG_16_64_10]|nr:MAG: hypothetical protein A2W31_05390 [Planctomycetes bacterium RBG_16_64_10]
MAHEKRCPRRRFLSHTGRLLVAGAAAPWWLPSRVLAAAGRVGANDRVGVGYIGVGRRANQLMDLPQDAQIVAVSDVHRARADAVAAARKCRAYGDYRALLDSKDVDAVVVATPDHWHALPSIHACQAGKDVYCEKPLTLTIREGRMLVHAVRKYDRVLQTGSQQRSMAANRRGCEWVRSGRIGRVHTVIGHNYASPWQAALPGQGVPTGLDWDRWCGQAPLEPYHEDLYLPRANPGWISFQPYSGGEMTGWGAHGLDQVQCALGMDHSGPVEIWTEGDPLQPPIYSAPESASRGNTACCRPTVLFRYASGVVLTLADGPPGGAIFIGDQGRITIDRGRLRVAPAELAEGPTEDATGSPPRADDHLQNWIDCVKSRTRPVADVETGHRSATLCHLGNIARWIGRPLWWDPDQEIFSGDADATALTDRPQRKPYQLPDAV